MSKNAETNGNFKVENSGKRKIIRSPVISCSRRTDIPAFLMDWVYEKIKMGYVDVQNPFNPNIISKVSLDPNDVFCWVWWSKDFGNWIKTYENKHNIIDQYPVHMFNFTINSRSPLESGINSNLDQRIKQATWIINKFGIESLQWRFDPIVFYKKNNLINNNLEDYELIASQLSSLGVRDVIFSFATWYPKVEKRMESRGKIPIKLELHEKHRIIDQILNIASKYKIQLKGCCQPDLIGYRGITQAHCISGEKIQKILKNHEKSISLVPDKGQREDCGCVKAQDIGGYHGIFKCKHNCDYCYANPSKI